MTWRERMILGGLLTLAGAIILFLVGTWLWDHVGDPAVGWWLDRRARRAARAADVEHVRHTAAALGIGNYRYPVEPVGVTRDHEIFDRVIGDVLTDQQRRLQRELDEADLQLWDLECRRPGGAE